MRIVVTGGTGLTGAVLLGKLASEHEVIALHRAGSGAPGIEGVDWLEQDLTMPLSKALPSRIDAVIHLAQSRRFREFPDGAADMFEINAAATVRLLHYCWSAGGVQFVYASSGAVYAPGARALKEYDSPKPANFYSVSKLLAEQAVDQFRDVLIASSLRFFFVYGPGQHDMLMPRLIEDIRRRRPVPLAGDQGIRVNPIYVEDAAAAVAAALGLERSGTFNVAGPEVISIRGIADLLGAELGVSPGFTHGPPQADLVGNTEQMGEHLHPPTIGVRDGLRRMLRSEGCDTTPG